MALFSATNAADSTTFNIISCDDDNGSVVGSGFLSVLYATGLTPGITYYIAVDKFGASTTAGTFCITVDELATSMLATTNTCASTYQTPGGAVSTYKGWVPLTDGSSRLVALVRNPAGGSVGSYTVSQNVNTGAIRQSASSSVFYLDRNFRIANTTATNVDVQLFFLTSEMAALTTADGTTLSQLAVTRQTETVAGCQNNYLESNGPSIVIPQTSNGTSNNVDWIQFTTPGFSNFYLNKVGTVLPIAVEYFTGAKQATGNSLNWKVNCNASASAVMVLERSADGVRFTAINSRTETSLRCLQPFNHIDAVPVAGMNYYRLKTVDVDGRVAYSNIVAILNREKGIEIVSMIPNPVKDMATLSIASATISKMDIIVSDVAGKQLMKQSVVLSAGSNTVPLNLAHLAAGTYQVTGYTAEGKVKTMRFVKQ
ncbi:MAG: T9SS type A sorting domain-containing protein [Pedobacter sp.]|nr:MAG: T9SS type A sorting domain-containing protein [Pedobacter sp.]